MLITGRGGPQDCETSRLPHSLGNLLTDGGEVIQLNLRVARCLEKCSPIFKNYAL
jgi:hypothetical protein